MKLSYQDSEEEKTQNVQSKTLWHDLNDDKFYIVNNFTGEQQQVNKNGDYIKRFNVDLTGQVGYHERIQKAQKKSCYMPYSTASLYKKPPFYIPQQDKFDGYAQMARPLVDPYNNNNNIRPATTMELSKREVSQKMKNQNRSINPLDYITGKAPDYLRAKKTQKIQVLQERKKTKELEYQEDQFKTINGKSLKIPNLNMHKPYQAPRPFTTMHRSKLKSKSKHNQSSLTGNVVEICPMENEKTINIQTYMKMQEELQQDENSLKKADLYKTLSFENKQQLSQKDTYTFKNLQDFNEEMEISQKQMKTFELPVQKEKNKLLTKGRFNQTISTNGDHYQYDRQLNMHIMPELYQDKENPRKMELEKQRRILNKLKEKEMLEKNLKNKV